MVSILPYFIEMKQEVGALVYSAFEKSFASRQAFGPIAFEVSQIGRTN